ncbi:hypothetical protein L1987_13800 [Smallanthus sonchifolius]|uniref:Uncharacterized protein n=1 Tax=Smallanthus sonchifolius TaxID=185202 RepID=A0ACB9JIJ1_9ASTR|nr:hypothetical protein L1987_13800 [Smallanthus sonchifolius]
MENPCMRKAVVMKDNRKKWSFTCLRPIEVQSLPLLEVRIVGVLSAPVLETVTFLATSFGHRMWARVTILAPLSGESEASNSSCLVG